MKIRTTCVPLLLAAALFAGCDGETNAEEIGESIDETLEDGAEGVGDAIEDGADATEDLLEDGADAIDDAVDGS